MLTVDTGTDADEDAELSESGEPAEAFIPIVPIKPTKQGGIKDVFKKVKAAFKKRDHSG